MGHKPYSVSLLALFLLLSAVSATAAPYPLPDDAVVDIQTFTFPEASAKTPERDLAAAFRTQLVFSLEQAGLTVFYARSDAPAPEDLAPSPLEVIVVTESDGDGGSESAPETTGQVEILPENEAGDSRLDHKAEEHGAELLPESVPGDGPPALAPPEQPVAQETAPSAPHPAAPTHILSGDVTLLREAVGNPTRIAGSIRIRSEASLHCSYRLQDAVTGKVLISDVASGSAARLSSQTQDLDSGLQLLTQKAMTTAAARIAGQLSGTGTTEEDVFSRSYYQDSPGKQVK